MGSFTNNIGIKNLHLITSAVLIIPIALTYGLYPETTLLKLFDITVENINLLTIFRGMMGLYLASAAVWILGVLNPRFWRTATATNIIFMGGLATGRLLSLVLDGMPSIYFFYGLLLEMALASWGIKNIMKWPGKT